MPKKTKKHKLRAKGRRKPLVLRVPVASQKKAASDAKTPHTSLTSTGIEMVKSKKQTSLFGDTRKSSAIFKQELIKSLMITTVLIIIQFGLFISAQTNFFDISSVIRF